VITVKSLTWAADSAKNKQEGGAKVDGFQQREKTIEENYEIGLWEQLRLGGNQ
jgi:hypothetical protein